MLVCDFMTRSVVSVLPDEPVALASRLLSRYNIGSLPVCSGGGRLCGIVTDRDIVLRCVAAGGDPEKTAVKDIMTKSVVSVAPEEDISRAAALMARARIRRLPVVRGGRLEGMLALGDIAWRPECDMEAARALGEISLGTRTV